MSVTTRVTLANTLSLTELYLNRYFYLEVFTSCVYIDIYIYIYVYAYVYVCVYIQRVYWCFVEAHLVEVQKTKIRSNT